jgi:hypothetical protein
VTTARDLASALRHYLMSDPVSHEVGASPDRTFRVDGLAAKLKVHPDVVREWALCIRLPSESQAAVLTWWVLPISEQPEPA